MPDNAAEQSAPGFEIESFSASAAFGRQDNVRPLGRSSRGRISDIHRPDHRRERDMILRHVEISLIWRRTECASSRKSRGRRETADHPCIGSGICIAVPGAAVRDLVHSESAYREASRRSDLDTVLLASDDTGLFYWPRDQSRAGSNCFANCVAGCASRAPSTELSCMAQFPGRA